MGCLDNAIIPNKITKRSFLKNGKINSLQSVDRECARACMHVGFGVVFGNFDCSELGLTSLVGAPEEVLGNFICCENNLTSLFGGPRIVNKDYNCTFNSLLSLDHAPLKVSWMMCQHNRLTSLRGAPRTIEGGFNCYQNPLTSFDGVPDYIGGNMDFTSRSLPPSELIKCVMFKAGSISCEDEDITALIIEFMHKKDMLGFQDALLDAGFL